MSNDLEALPPGVVLATPAPAAPPAPSTKTVAERLAEKRANAAKRELAAQAAREAAELERLELEERFEVELQGRKGQAFAIVDASELGEGHIVVRLGDDVIFNAFKASKMNVVDVETFVAPCLVHPSLDAYRAIAKRRPQIAERCAAALGALYGVKTEAEAGK